MHGMEGHVDNAGYQLDGNPARINRADATRPASLSAASEPNTMPATMDTNITAYCVGGRPNSLPRKAGTEAT
jgi:hypothetical protein